MTIANVSTAYFFEQTRLGLMRTQSALDEAQRQVSSGQKVSSLADAGVGAAPIVGAREMLSRVDTRTQALQEFAPRLEAQDFSLGRTSDVARSLKDQVLSMVTLNDGGALVDRLQEAFTAATTEMNTQWNGVYVFGGERVTSPPVVIANLTALAALPNGQAAFNVAQRTQTIDLGDGFQAAVADRGVDVAGGLFDALRDLKVLLDANGGSLGKPLTAPQKTSLEAAITKLTQAATDLTQGQARNGALQNRVDREIEAGQSRSILLQKTIGDAVDADLAQVSITLNQLKTQYQVSASTFATLKDLNLMNFLR
jgi:flagellin-like hook-associated protein FlgL